MDISDDDFSDHGSGADLRDESLSPDIDGMAQRTRSRKTDIPKQSSSGGYAWEDEYKRPWDIVKDDDESGRSMETLIQKTIEIRKKKIMRNPTTPFQRGIIRTLIVVIDGSSAMLEKDLRPTRFSAMLSYLQEFVTEFFDQNPISQLGIVMMRNGMAHLVSEVSGSPQYHLDKIRTLKSRQHNRYEPKGDPSLQNALELARSLLTANFEGMASSSNKNSKEILIIFGALFTSDPGDIHKTIDSLVKENIKVKVIGLSAQVAICQEIVSRTNFPATPKVKIRIDIANFYGVIMNESHFKELLMSCVEPLAVTTKSAEAIKGSSTGVPLIRMGFPSKVHPYSNASTMLIQSNFPHLCSCHLSSAQEEAKDLVQIQTGPQEYPSGSNAGYRCPQCNSSVCHLPTTCPVCGLMLILSTHLARSYHHLVPLASFYEVPVAPRYDHQYCFGCLLKFPEGKSSSTELTQTSSRYRCEKCSNDFCIDCDVFVHESLHNCPGCESKA
ncbi:hypothetical protein FT663_05215 [Candidozyma haemuli var. vulneris]|nr:hypothetical protein FT663_05215 [[Candida] haemuloni var. vulneris]KAF3986217.1 hypothetical protein FT662_04694 [[Candida] haemuloni var. vulneris]